MERFTIALKFIQANVSWIIGNGEKILIWNCNWVPCKDGLRKLISPISKTNASLKELWGSNRTWNENKVRRDFTNKKDVEKTLKTYILRASCEDKKICSYMKVGHVSIKSTYKDIQNAVNQSDIQNASLNWKNHWEINFPSKVFTFG